MGGKDISIFSSMTERLDTLEEEDEVEEEVDSDMVKWMVRGMRGLRRVGDESVTALGACCAGETEERPKRERKWNYRESDREGIMGGAVSWPAGDGLGCVVERWKIKKALKVARLGIARPVNARQGRLVASATHSFQAHGSLQLATLDLIPAMGQCKP